MRKARAQPPKLVRAAEKRGSAPISFVKSLPPASHDKSPIPQHGVERIAPPAGQEREGIAFERDKGLTRTDAVRSLMDADATIGTGAIATWIAGQGTASNAAASHALFLDGVLTGHQGIPRSATPAGAVFFTKGGRKIPAS